MGFRMGLGMDLQYGSQEGSQEGSQDGAVVFFGEQGYCQWLMGGCGFGATHHVARALAPGEPKGPGSERCRGHRVLGTFKS